MNEIRIVEGLYGDWFLYREKERIGTSEKHGDAILFAAAPAMKRALEMDKGAHWHGDSVLRAAALLIKQGPHGYCGIKLCEKLLAKAD